MGTITWLGWQDHPVDNGLQMSFAPVVRRSHKDLPATDPPGPEGGGQPQEEDQGKGQDTQEGTQP